MTRVLGRTLAEIRRDLDLPHLPAAVGTAVHEAAHATVAMAVGSIVSEVYIRASETRTAAGWHGECFYSQYGLSVEAERHIIIAGVAGSSYLHTSVITLDSPLRGTHQDFQRLKDLGVLPAGRSGYYDTARAILRTNLDTFDHIATALLTKADGLHMGYLDESDMSIIATLLPVRWPDSSQPEIQHRMMQHDTPEGVRL